MQGIDATSLPRTLETPDAMPGGLTAFERALWLVTLVEIPLQFDKYLFFRPDDAAVGSIGGLNVSLTSFCILGLLVCWCMRAVEGRTRPSRALHLGWLPLTFLLLSILSVFAATDRQLVLFEVGLLVQAYLLYVLAANRIETENDAQWLMGGVVVSGLVQSVLVLMSVAWYHLAGIQELSIGPVDILVSDEGRPGGTLRSPTGLGSMLTLLMLLSAPCAALVARQWRWVARGALALILFGLTAVLLTQTRAAVGTSLLGLAGIAGWIWYRGWMPRRAALLFIVAGLVMAGPLLLVIQQRVLQDDRGSAASRVHMTQIALELISDRGLLGVGAGNAHVALQDYATQSPYRSEWFYLTHCKYLIVWAEIGILGLITFVAMLLVGVGRGVRLMVSPVQWLSLVGLGVAAALVAHGLHMFVDLFNGRPHVEMLWLVLGLVVALHRMHAAESQRAASFVPAHSQ
ncbi:MAG: O-antigen ligase family protein [Planctomycetota bacterium]|nr:MAG: O-antigen ligase family protein [Planctomycetota bacterium]